MENIQTYIKKSNKKGQLGMDTAKQVMLILLTLAVVAIAMFVALNSIVSSNTSLNTKTIKYVPFTNVSVFLQNTTPVTISTFTGLSNVVLSSVIVVNGSNTVVVNANNYTISAGTIRGNNNDATLNNTNVNVSGFYQYDVNGDALNVQNNITTGTTNFFSNIPTVFTILGAVVIILAIILILFAVTRIKNKVETI